MFPTLVALSVSFLATEAADNYTPNDNTNTDGNGSTHAEGLHKMRAASHMWRGGGKIK